MSMTPRVLVLMATFNGAPWLEEQIESVLSQQGADISLNVRDDGSTDSTLEILEEKAKSDSRVRIIPSDFATASAAGNFYQLILSAQPEDVDYVAFSDQDDLWHKDKLSKGVAWLVQEKADGYSCAVNAFWADGRQKVLSQSPQTRAMDFIFEGAGQGCTFVLPVENFRNVQKQLRANFKVFSQFHYHDWLTYLIVRTSGGKWVFDQVPHMEYRQHGGNEIGARGFQGLKKRMQLISSGWYTKQMRLALIACDLMARQDHSLGLMSKLLEEKDGLWRRLKFCFYMMKYGRRRFTDRIFLSSIVAVGLLR